MSKTIKMQPDKFKKLINKQDEPKRPTTLGESIMNTDWDYHMLNKHKLKNFTKVQEDRDPLTGEIIIDPKTKQPIFKAFINTPKKDQIFVCAKEEFLGYYYIWIICLNEKTGQIIFRANTGEFDFVTWDIPAENTK
jgi:hypothetical protein